MGIRLPPALVLFATALAALSGCATYGDEWYEASYQRPSERPSRYYSDNRDDHYRREGARRHDRRGHRARYADRVDREIHDRVHAALNHRLDASGIRVIVRQRNVYLRGHVRNRHHRRRAHRIAHDVRGVRSVYYRELRVAGW